LLFGDSPHDLAVVRVAGALAVGATWGACGRDALLPYADHLLDDVRALPALVRAQAG
jgi:phosphoglycolate phosphatase